MLDSLEWASNFPNLLLYPPRSDATLCQLGGTIFVASSSSSSLHQSLSVPVVKLRKSQLYKYRQHRYLYCYYLCYFFPLVKTFVMSKRLCNSFLCL